MTPSRPLSHEQRWRAAHGADATRGESRQDHDRRTADPRQAEAERIRRGGRWARVRASALRREPLCRTCKARGFTEPSRQIDHIAPLVERPDLAYTMSNLQALCTSCHAAKSARERTSRTT